MAILHVRSIPSENERRRAAAIMRQIRADIETRRRDWPPDVPAVDGVGLIHECREERERQAQG